jgi:hypothetical protein
VKTPLRVKQRVSDDRLRKIEHLRQVWEEAEERAREAAAGAKTALDAYNRARATSAAAKVTSALHPLVE